jgi:hypothetical protein
VDWETANMAKLTCGEHWGRAFGNGLTAWRLISMSHLKIGSFPGWAMHCGDSGGPRAPAGPLADAQRIHHAAGSL